MASEDLLHPPAFIPNASALRLSQQAPRITAKSPTSSLPYPLSLLASSETEETWTTYENLFLSCLRTGDNVAARQCIDHLTTRFGPTNERIMALTGIYKEAVAETSQTLEKVLHRYDEVLEADPTNMPVRKRRVATLKSLDRPADAITALVELLDISPTDAEGWAELSELYLGQGMFSQAVYSLEEVLLIFPNAWAMQARMGEILYLSHLATPSDLSSLNESIRRFCRSIELCDDYLRGYYGLKLASQKLLSVGFKSSNSRALAVTDDLPPLSQEKVQKLRELATKKLSVMLRKMSSSKNNGEVQAELAAAKELLDRDSQEVVR